MLRPASPTRRPTPPSKGSPRAKRREVQPPGRVGSGGAMDAGFVATKKGTVLAVQCVRVAARAPPPPLAPGPALTDVEARRPGPPRVSLEGEASCREVLRPLGVMRAEAAEAAAFPRALPARPGPPFPWWPCTGIAAGGRGLGVPDSLPPHGRRDRHDTADLTNPPDPLGAPPPPPPFPLPHPQVCALVAFSAMSSSGESRRRCRGRLLLPAPAGREGG